MVMFGIIKLNILHKLVKMINKKINMEKKIGSATVAVFNPNNDGSILCMTRRDNYNDIGFPGGKIDLENGELPIDAAVRECYEETGMLVNKESLFPIYTGFARSMNCITYYAKEIIGGKLLQVSKEGMPLWVHPHMLIKDSCTYKHYNLIVIQNLIKKGIIQI